MHPSKFPNNRLYGNSYCPFGIAEIRKRSYAKPLPRAVIFLQNRFRSQKRCSCHLPPRGGGQSDVPLWSRPVGFCTRVFSDTALPNRRLGAARPGSGPRAPVGRTTRAHTRAGEQHAREHDEDACSAPRGAAQAPGPESGALRARTRAPVSSTHENTKSMLCTATSTASHGTPCGRSRSEPER